MIEATKEFKLSDFPLYQQKDGEAKYPWHTMNINESFLYAGTISTAQSRASRLRKLLGKKFACRSTDLGVRIWRIT